MKREESFSYRATTRTAKAIHFLSPLLNIGTDSLRESGLLAAVNPSRDDFLN